MTGCNLLRVNTFFRIGWRLTGKHERENAMKSVKCKEIIKDLHMILEKDRGSDKLCDQIQAHLENCDSCAQQHKELKELVHLCQRFPDVPIPDDQKKKMKEELKKLLLTR